jgi:hypothetical protein
LTKPSRDLKVVEEAVEEAVVEDQEAHQQYPHFHPMP